MPLSLRASSVRPKAPGIAIAISKNRVENINAVPDKSPSLPVRLGVAAFFAPSKNAPNVDNATVAT
jgi:hypothetical protein